MMHKNSFVIRLPADREYSREQEYETAKDAFDAMGPARGSRGVFIKARDESSTFVGFFGPISRP
ncbi:MAG: hypothetical protein WA766_06085 [Candidatus Acidiferrales bacterium]